MSFPSPHPAQPPMPPAQQPALPTERVAFGLLAATGAVVAGVALTVVVWRLGYVAAITSLAIAFGAAFLYEAAAGRSPRKGLVPLLLLIVLGVVLSFFAVVASDAWDAYDQLGITEPSKATVIRQAIFEPEILQEYGKDMALFGVFAVIGIFGVARRLIAAR